MSDSDLTQEDSLDKNSYQSIDALLCASQFEQIDAILRAVNVSAISIVETRTYLTITRAAKQELREREALLERFREHVEKAEPEDSKSLLRRL